MLRFGVPEARWYLAGQAAAGAGWWVAVATSPRVRAATLGDLPAAVLAVPDLLLFVGASALAAGLGSRRWAGVALAWTALVTGGLWAYALATRQAGWGAIAMAAALTGTVGAALTLTHGGLPGHWIIVGPFRFRPAPADRSPGAHLRQSLRQLVVFWVAFFVVVPLALRWVEGQLRLHGSALDGPAAIVAGAVLLVVFSAVGIWSCVTMALRGSGTPLPAATARDLVVAGPYRWVRNPMAVAGGAQTIAVGLIVGSWLVVVVAVAGGALWDVAIRPQEEADLATRFGPAFARYRAAVRCWLPRLRPVDATPPP